MFCMMIKLTVYKTLISHPIMQPVRKRMEINCFGFRLSSFEYNIYKVINPHVEVEYLLLECLYLER